MTHVRSGAACAGKIGYASKAEARHFLRITNRTRPGQRHVYRCTTCKLWHIGKKVRKQDAKDAGHVKRGKKHDGE